MSVEIWPPIAPEQLKIEEDATQARELSWLLTRSLPPILATLKTSIEETYALLAPIDPGSTLVLSTPRHETVKGHITRIGTRLVKGTVALKLRTRDPILLVLDPDHHIHVPELETLNDSLTGAVDLLARIASVPPEKTAPNTLSDQLRTLSQYLSEALAIIKGPPEKPEHPDMRWTAASVPPGCFSPPLRSNLSFYITVRDASLVLYLRALESADAPVNFGTKLALAIGTSRRLEHDEADRVFGYCPEGADEFVHNTPPVPGGFGGGMGKGRGTEVKVYVREKVRVETADPSLLSLSAKLAALSHTIAVARRNLAAVMGEVE